MASNKIKKTFSKSRMGARFPRAVIPLERKLDIIYRAEVGERACEIARSEGLPQSTVRSIVAMSDKIKRNAREPLPAQPKNPIMVAMEKELAFWYHRNSQLGIPISLERLRNKALDIYRNLAKSKKNAPVFTASKEWLVRYKRKLRRSTAENETAVSSSNGEEDNCDFIQSFKDIITKEAFEPEQVFSVMETSFNYKEIITKPFTQTKDLQMKDANIMLLMASNASGDFKLKPLVVHSDNKLPELKGYLSCNYPVIWKSNSNTQMTPVIFSEWFVEHFCPTVQLYLHSKNLSEKALLILDSNNSYPTTLEDLNDTVKVLHFPTEISPLSCHTDNSVCKHFKAEYILQAMSNTMIFEEDHLSPFQNNFDMRTVMDIVANVWENISSSIIKLAWVNLYPDHNIEQDRVMEEFKVLFQNISDFSKEINLELTSEEQLLKLLQSEDSFPIELDQADIQKLENATDMEDPIRTLTSDSLQEALRHLETAMSIYRDNDPNLERSLTVCRNIQNAVTCYKQLHAQKKVLANQYSSANYSTCDPMDILDIQLEESVSMQPAICFYEEPSIKLELPSD